jgi:integrase
MADNAASDDLPSNDLPSNDLPSSDAPSDDGPSEGASSEDTFPPRSPRTAARGGAGGEKNGEGDPPAPAGRGGQLQERPSRTPAKSDELFAQDIEGAQGFAEKALSDRTLAAYENAWSDFEAYCEEVSRRALPADPITVAAYLNRRARIRPTERGAPPERADKGLAASTLEQRLAAIRYVHEANGHSSPTDHPQVSQVMQGIRNDAERQADLPKTEAEPLVSSDIREILDVLPGDGLPPPRSETRAYAQWLRGLRDRALILLGFASSLRPRELVAVSKRHVQREPEGLVVHIPRSKTDQEAEGQRVTVLYNTANVRACPVRSLTRWMEEAGIDSGPLFRGVKRNAEVRPDGLSYRTLNRVVKQSCRQAGLSTASFSEAKERRYSAHSLRAGHVTDAAAGGAPDSIIMMQTRHADPATLRKYDRPAQQLDDSSSGFLALYRDDDEDDA